MPHAVYGEEPFVVVRDSDAGILDSIAARVKSGLGEGYTLRGVATLGELGFGDFPKNPSGKIVKLQLRDAAVSFMRASDEVADRGLDVGLNGNGVHGKTNPSGETDGRVPN